MSPSIPARIHFIFLSKTEAVHPAFEACIEAVQQLHPSWEIKRYNEDDAQAILSTHLPELLPIYNSYTHRVQRSDILRVILVYLFGGFYMDMDMFPLKSLDELLDHDLVLGKERILSDDELNHLEARHRFRIGNYMFGGKPRHPFWLSFLKESIKYSQQKVQYENDIIRSTGPELLTNVYHSHKKKYKNITILDNSDRMCITLWHDCLGCHFGSYAGHLHTGTWRWKWREKQLISSQPVSDKDYRHAAAGIHTLLKNSLPFSEAFILLQTNREHLITQENLLHLYTKMSVVYPVVRDSGNLYNKVVLAFGDPRLHEKHTSPQNTNILYTIPAENQLTDNWIASLNRAYHSCIVPHAWYKELLIAKGAHIPVTVIPLGFKRRLRNFVEEDDDIEMPFTVALPIKNNEQHIEAVITACEQLRKTDIPNLHLKLIFDSNYSQPGKELRASLRQSDFIELLDIANMFARKFDAIHCFVFCDQHNHWTLGPRESLYEGIPAIITNNPVFDELIRSGFYHVVDRQEPTSLIDGILMVHNNYPALNELAVKGSTWIQDRWTLEYTMLELYRHLKNSDSFQPKASINLNY